MVKQLTEAQGNNVLPVGSDMFTGWAIRVIDANSTALTIVSQYLPQMASSQGHLIYIQFKHTTHNVSFVFYSPYYFLKYYISYLFYLLPVFPQLE